MAVEELQSIIKRCQILKEQDFKEEDFGLFQLAGQRCLDEGHIDQLVEIIQNEKNKLALCSMEVLESNRELLIVGVIVKNMGWNLVGPVVRCLLWNDKEDDKRKYYFLMLDVLVKKLRKNKAYSVGLALSTLWSQLSLLPVPCSEEQARADDHGLCRCCKALTEFAQPFVEEVTADKENSMENEKLKDELLKLKKKTWDYLEFEEEEHKQLSDSLASLAYLVFVQGISIDQLPMVLRTEESVFSKGLDLLENGLLRLEDNSLLHQYLEIKSFLTVPQTGLWTELEKIEKNFLKPLHIGLNMSKAHYEAEIKNSQEVQKSKDLCSVTVGGEEIPNMPPEMQLKVLHSALFTFDLIESVLARVEELIEMKTKSTL
ncbi:glomulin isoform 2 [Camelus ferus]|nr:glomulin isoform 2 [Camelus ferus]